jgi:hypothetical protein
MDSEDDVLPTPTWKVRGSNTEHWLINPETKVTGMFSRKTGAKENPINRGEPRLKLDLGSDSDGEKGGRDDQKTTRLNRSVDEDAGKDLTEMVAISEFELARMCRTLAETKKQLKKEHDGSVRRMLEARVCSDMKRVEDLMSVVEDARAEFSKLPKHWLVELELKKAELAKAVHETPGKSLTVKQDERFEEEVGGMPAKAYRELMTKIQTNGLTALSLEKCKLPSTLGGGENYMAWVAKIKEVWRMFFPKHKGLTSFINAINDATISNTELEEVPDELQVLDQQLAIDIRDKCLVAKDPIHQLIRTKLIGRSLAEKAPNWRVSMRIIQQAFGANLRNIAKNARERFHMLQLKDAKGLTEFMALMERFSLVAEGDHDYSISKALKRDKLLNGLRKAGDPQLVSMASSMLLSDTDYDIAVQKLTELIALTPVTYGASKGENDPDHSKAVTGGVLGETLDGGQRPEAMSGKAPGEPKPARKECHYCGKGGHMARDCWRKPSSPGYRPPTPNHPEIKSNYKNNVENYGEKPRKKKRKLSIIDFNKIAANIRDRTGMRNLNKFGPRYIVDSGTSVHTRRNIEGCVAGSVRKVSPIWAMTGNGTTICNTKATFYVPELEVEVDAYIMKNGLNLISTTELLRANGIATYLDEKPRLQKRDGGTVPLQYHHGVPCLAHIAKRPFTSPRISLNKDETNVPCPASNRDAVQEDDDEHQKVYSTEPGGNAKDEATLEYSKEYETLRSDLCPTQDDDDNPASTCEDNREDRTSHQSKKIQESFVLDLEDGKAFVTDGAIIVANHEGHLTDVVTASLILNPSTGAQTKRYGLPHECLHLPADPHHCEHCLRAKLRSKAGRRDKNSLYEYAKEVGERTSADFVHAQKRDVLGKINMFTFCDEFSDWLCFHPQSEPPDAESALDGFRKAKIELKSEIKRIRTDNGPEFQGDFKKEMQRLYVNHVYGTPNKPTTEARHESKHRTLNESIRVMLHFAGLTSDFWSPAALHYAYLRNRFVVNPRSNLTPYAAIHGFEFQGPAVALGQEVIYKDVKRKEGETDKYETKARRGVYMGSRHSGHLVMDFDHFRNTMGRVKFLVTSDVRFVNGSYPCRELDLVRGTRDGWTLLESGESVGTCDTCQKQRVRFPILCKKCSPEMRSRRGGRHRTDTYCAQQRCLCQEWLEELSNSPTDESTDEVEDPPANWDDGVARDDTNTMTVAIEPIADNNIVMAGMWKTGISDEAKHRGLIFTITRTEEETINECQRLMRGEFIDEQICGLILHDQEDDSETIGVFKQMKLPDFAADPKGREAILKELKMIIFIVHSHHGSKTVRQ